MEYEYQLIERIIRKKLCKRAQCNGIQSSNGTKKASEYTIAGVDEAGRGCLAGPVVAAAVIMPHDTSIANLIDSKQLRSHQRDEIALQIKKEALAWGIGVVWPKEIDKINILQAALKAMANAIAVLKVMPKLVLIDGTIVIPQVYLEGCSLCGMFIQKTVVKGDVRVPVISAASILAKTFRDMLMTKLDKRYPIYGFARHKGYGTKEHREKLEMYGPSTMHRMTFRWVRKVPDTKKMVQEELYGI